MKIRYSSMDCIKGAACIAVVLIHYNFPGYLGIIVKTLSRFAVPFFFGVSGYFLVNSFGGITKQNILKKIRHIVKITALSCAFYAVFCVIWNYFMYPDWSLRGYVAETFTVAKLLKFLITNDPFVYAHLWFLFALIYCYLLFLILKIKDRIPEYFSVIVLILLAVFTVLAELNGVLGIRNSITIPGSDKILVLSNLFIFRALPFFMAGIVLREKSEKIISKRYNNKILLILILFGEGLSLVERYLFVESQFYVGTYLVVGTLFVFAISNPDFKIPFMEYIGKYMSMYVYIFHIAVGKTLDYIANKQHLWQNQVFMYSRAFIVLFGSLIIAFVIVKMQEKAVKVLKLNLN